MLVSTKLSNSSRNYKSLHVSNASGSTAPQLSLLAVAVVWFCTSATKVNSSCGSGKWIEFQGCHLGAVLPAAVRRCCLCKARAGTMIRSLRGSPICIISTGDKDVIKHAVSALSLSLSLSLSLPLSLYVSNSSPLLAPLSHSLYSPSLSLSLPPFSSYPFWPCSPLSSTISVALTALFFTVTSHPLSQFPCASLSNSQCAVLLKPRQKKKPGYWKQNVFY